MKPVWRRTISPNRVAAALASSVALAVAAISPARAVEYDTLRIASWGLSGLWHVPGEALRREAGQRVTSPLARDAFRTLRDQAEALDADIVTLQGVGSPQAVQRVFPARDYFLIFSRQLLERYSEDRRALDDPHFRQSYTAIVIRRDRSLRLLAREHVSTLAVAGKGGKGPATTPAGLAVKIVADGHEFWTLAVDLTANCETPAASVEPAPGAALPGQSGPTAVPPTDAVAPAPCRRLEEQAIALAQWIGRKQADGERVIVAGSFVDGLAMASADADVRRLWSAIGGTASPAADKGPPLLAPLRGTRPVSVTEAELALVGVGASERRKQMRISRQFSYDQARSLRKQRSKRLSPGTEPLLEPAATAAAKVNEPATALAAGQRDGSVASLVFDAFRAFISASRAPTRAEPEAKLASKPKADDDSAAAPPSGHALAGTGQPADAPPGTGGQASELQQAQQMGHPTLAILPRGPVPAGCEAGAAIANGSAAQPDGDAHTSQSPRTREYLLVDRALFGSVEAVAQGHLTWDGAKDDPRRSTARGCPVFVDLPLGS